MIDRERLELIAHAQSRFQAENFVVRRNGFDAYGCYRQAARELLARLDAQDLIVIDIEEAQEAADRQTTSAAEDRDRRRAEIRLRGLHRKARALAREANIYDMIVEQLDPLFAELTDEELEAVEATHWLNRLTIEARRDIASFGAVAREHRALIESAPQAFCAAVMRDALAGPPAALPNGEGD